MNAVGEIVVVLLAGIAMTAVLIGLANAQDHIRVADRLRHQRALADEARAYGDCPHVPDELVP